jgi:hypothetical protein
MNFSPYHNFTACDRLERAINKCHEVGNVADVLFSQFELYHYSLVHKVKSAKYHVQTLQEYLLTHTPANTDLSDIAYRVNFHFDGFLHLLGSSGDIFAREVLCYFGEPLPTRVYFMKAFRRLNHTRPGDPVLPLIDRPSWKPEFDEYRNTATHESFIGTGFTIEVEMHGDIPQQRLQFPIPDDPRVIARTYSRNPDIVAYCDKTLTRHLRLFNGAYRNIAGRIRATGHLPI